MKATPVAAGEKYGRWTTLEDARIAKRATVLCRCECGAERRVEGYSLRSGNSKSCGCLRHEILTAPRTTCYIRAGERFGRYLALEDAPRSNMHVSCKCDCGTTRNVWATSLRHGRSQSCGCLAREATAARNTTHGLRHHPLYVTWRGMTHRCNDPGWPGYADYGGRGITVCERWTGLPDGLLNFAADMGTKPGPGYSVERNDNDGNYEPGNCRWATQKEQCANMRPRATQAALEVLRAENRRLAERVAELEHLLTLGALLEESA